MHPYYFDFDAARTRRAAAILVFERNRRRGAYPLITDKKLVMLLSVTEMIA